VAECTALYRELLAQRRVLVLLDNASNVEQLRPLLPPPSCLALVTSRDGLADLATMDGASLIQLDVLALDEAVALLRVLIGPRADREPQAVRTLALRCGCLPLALRVAAEHVAFRQQSAMADLVAELDADGQTLDGLAIDDARSDVRAVFSWSVRRLPAQAARIFGLMGLSPGVDLDRFALANLGGIDADEVDRLTLVVIRAHLVQADEHGRLTMHDLLRAYSAERAARDLAEHDRSAGMTRLLEYYLAVAAKATSLLFPRFRANGGPRPEWPGSAPRVDDVAAASAWLAAERTNLVRTCLHAASHGWPGHAVALAVTIGRFLDDGHDDDAHAVQTAALAAADLAGDACDATDRAMVRLEAGFSNWRVGQHDLAAEYVEQALDDFTRLGDAVGASRSLGTLGAIRDWQGRYGEAVQCQLRGLELTRSAGLKTQEGRHLINLAFAYVRMEQYEAAAQACRQAIDVLEPTGETLMLAEPRYYLAIVYVELERHLDEAVALAEDVIAVAVEHGRSTMTAIAVHAVGYAYLRMGDLARGIDILGEALTMARKLDSSSALAELLNAYGEACRRTGDHPRAIECHGEALELSQRAGDRQEVARSEEFLGQAFAAAGRTAAASEHWQRALRGYTDLGITTAMDRLGGRLRDIQVTVTPDRTADPNRTVGGA
jgi:tetratricopeptide (TPR) repeat protein